MDKKTNLIEQIKNHYYNDEFFCREISNLFEKILPVKENFEPEGFNTVINYCKDNYGDDWFVAYEYLYW